MKDLLEYIVKHLVSHPDDVVINEEIRDGTDTLTLTVNPEDMGMVIGKSGQTIKAIRRLLIARALADNRNLRVNLTVTETGSDSTGVSS